MKKILENVNTPLYAGILAPVLLALGTWEPLVKSSLGEAYGVAGGSSTAIYIYAITIALLVANIFSDKIRKDIANRLQIVAMIVVTGCLIFGLQVTIEGMQWFNVQTAFNVPGIEGANLDAFWATLSNFGVGETSMGSLRSLYETWGPMVAQNDIPVYQNTINSLNPAQLKSLLAAGEISYFVIPAGILFYLASFISQIFVLLSISKNKNKFS
ncbi:hypothetical protein [Duganella levis]|uniref:Uncharacterized protein n=1 Tax=Duganella levis TaxID=2692169 RepID=A0ABW9VZ47_9BURK|nr:hypothetical protein [Duganella levis]MYN26941.1 hypothetical protein [Duganella levis]